MEDIKVEEIEEGPSFSDLMWWGCKPWKRIPLMSDPD